MAKRDNEQQPLVGPPVKRGRGRPRKVPVNSGPDKGALIITDRPGRNDWKDCEKPAPPKAAAATTTTNKCSVRITASEREIAEAKEAARENGPGDKSGAPVDSEEDIVVFSRKTVASPPPQSRLPPPPPPQVRPKA